jgi:hypothetical protein
MVLAESARTTFVSGCETAEFGCGLHDGTEHAAQARRSGCRSLWQQGDYQSDRSHPVPRFVLSPRLRGYPVWTSLAAGTLPAMSVDRCGDVHTMGSTPAHPPRVGGPVKERL